MSNTKNTCPHCASTNLIRSGLYRGKQRYLCKNCFCISIREMPNEFLANDTPAVLAINNTKNPCPHCAETKIVRSGFYQGKQRYVCKNCRRVFVKKMPSFSERYKNLATTLHLSGISMNAIAQIIGTSVDSIMRWMRENANELPKSPPQITGPVEIATDEIHQYIKSNNSISAVEKHLIIKVNHSSLPGAAVIVLQKP